MMNICHQGKVLKRKLFLPGHVNSVDKSQMQSMCLHQSYQNFLPQTSAGSCLFLKVSLSQRETVYINVFMAEIKVVALFCLAGLMTICFLSSPTGPQTAFWLLSRVTVYGLWHIQAFNKCLLKMNEVWGGAASGILAKVQEGEFLGSKGIVNRCYGLRKDLQIS